MLGAWLTFVTLGVTLTSGYDFLGFGSAANRPVVEPI
jgi:hypothetical protein